jgi:hypothetical protein
MFGLVLALGGIALAGCSGADLVSAPTPAPQLITVVVIATPEATPAPQDSPVPPEASPVPNQPTPTLEQLDSNALPTPTLEPLVSNTIPGNGQQFDSLPFVTTANDPAIGPNNGDGIESVTFQFFGPDANLVFEQTDGSAQFCAFGGGDNGADCTNWIFSEHGNRFPNGNEATPGGYTLKVTVRGTRGQVTEEERLITLDLDTTPTPTLEPLVSNTFPSGTEFGDDLFFQANANDPGVGPNDGDGIATVKFEIFGPNGDLVHTQTERNSLFCAFGGGDNGQDCNHWVFSEHNNQWPNGTPLENGGTYRLVATFTSTRGQISTQELTFTITVP